MLANEQNSGGWDARVLEPVADRRQPTDRKIERSTVAVPTRPTGGPACDGVDRQQPVSLDELFDVLVLPGASVLEFALATAGDGVEIRSAVARSLLD